MVVEVEGSNGMRRKLNVSFNIKRTMVDGKLRGIISGRSGAHCINCDWEVRDYWIWNDPKKKNPNRNPLPMVRITGYDKRNLREI